MLGIVDDGGKFASSFLNVQERVREVLMRLRVRSEVVMVVDGPREMFL